MCLDSILLAEVDDRADGVFLHEKVNIIINDAWFSNRKSDIKESKRVLKMQQRLLSLSLSALRSTYYEVETQAFGNIIPKQLLQSSKYWPDSCK